MSWTASAEFFTDSRMWILPILVGGVFIVGTVLKRGRVSASAWRGFFNLESSLVGAVLGVVYGPRWPTVVAEHADVSVSLTWDAVLTSMVLVGAFVMLAVSVRSLLKQPSLQWVGLASAAYAVGVSANVILLRGGPLTEAFG